MRRFATMLTALAALLLPPTASMAQDAPIISRDLYTERLNRDGDAVTICVNPDGMLAPFDTRVAQLLGDALLLRMTVNPVKMPRNTQPLDYRLPLDFNQLFVVLAEECDGFMGFVLGGGTYPSWVRLTEPYLVSDMALVVTDPAIRELADLPLDRPIGTRSLSAADNQLIGYLNARPAAQRRKRQAFFSNDQIFAALSDGRLGAAMIWRPALDEVTGGDLASAGLYEVPMPFVATEVQIGMVLQSANSYLQVAFSDAIRSLIADGSIQRAYDETIGVD